MEADDAPKPPATEQAATEPKAPIVAYRIEPMRIIQINKEHSQRSARARTLAILRSSLFGRKRYQDIYLNCSLNNMFNALRIANFLHNRVPDLALIIKLVPIKIIEVFSDGSRQQSHQITDRKRVEIKLTTQPTEHDQQQPGYNAGIQKDKIKDPIEGLVIRNDDKGNRPQKRRFKDRGGQGGRRRNDRDRDSKDRRREDEYRRDQRQQPRKKRDYEERRNKRQQQARKERREPDREQRRYRRADHDELEDDNSRREVRKTRGSNRSKTSNSQDRVQTEHHYEARHMNRNPDDKS